MTPDISEYSDIFFYACVWYRINLIERWLSVSNQVGSIMSFGILATNAKLISLITVQTVSTVKAATSDLKKLCMKFRNAVDHKNQDKEFIANLEDESQVRDPHEISSDAEGERRE